MSSYTFFSTADGQTILVLAILVFLLLLVAILVGFVCFLLWRNSIKCRRCFLQTGIEDEQTLFYDRTRRATMNNGGYIYPGEQSIGTQTDLTAVVVVENSNPRKVPVASRAPMTTTLAQPQSHDFDAKSRWSRINPKIYLNPWTYRSPRLPDNTPVVSQSPRNVYVDEI